MSAARLATILASATLTLTACGGVSDPREGLVTISWSNCLWGDCWELTEICRGTTLVTAFSDGYSKNDWTEETLDSPKCQPQAAVGAA